jgi:hypothetical protein
MRRARTGDHVLWDVGDLPPPVVVPVGPSAGGVPSGGGAPLVTINPQTGAATLAAVPIGQAPPPGYAAAVASLPPGAVSVQPGTLAAGNQRAAFEQAAAQALGMGPASSPLGSLLGAGLGGTAPGTGPLPGTLGALASQVFGQPGFPPGGNAVLPQLATHTEQVGRAIVRRILGATMPQLDAIRQLIEYRRNQIQATAESHQLSTAAAFHGQVMGQLQALQSAVASGPGVGPGGWARY